MELLVVAPITQAVKNIKQEAFYNYFFKHPAQICATEILSVCICVVLTKNPKTPSNVSVYCIIETTAVLCTVVFVTTPGF